ncbi:hypothetical protein B0H13DRAFT_1908824 [Mycena leptocephala]|nr:hypothetical protein B0H13DRAFT_1908824 [Mycena leptocephala]
MIRGYTAWLGTEQRGGTGERRRRARDKGEEKGRRGKSGTLAAPARCHSAGSVGVAMGRRMSQVSKAGKKARDNWTNLDLLVRTQLDPVFAGLFSACTRVHFHLRCTWRALAFIFILQLAASGAGTQELHHFILELCGTSVAPELKSICKT